MTHSLRPTGPPSSVPVPISKSFASLGASGPASVPPGELLPPPHPANSRSEAERIVVTRAGERRRAVLLMVSIRATPMLRARSDDHVFAAQVGISIYGRREIAGVGTRNVSLAGVVFAAFREWNLTYRPRGDPRVISRGF